MKLQEKLKQVQLQHKAILATNFYNFETLKGIISAVKEMNQPIIFQLTQSSIDYMGLENAVAMARSVIKSYNVEAWLHLDHGGSVNMVEKCLKAGFDSVMFDGSELPFEENVKLTKKVVVMAKDYDANVEAELGFVAKLGQDYGKKVFTEPSDAKDFVEETGVNALAVAIGTAHGFYKEEPKLDITRLSKIRKATDVCLVLHGASGVPDDQVKKAVEAGICKVNVATETKNAFMQSLQQLLRNNEEIDLRKVFPPAIETVKALIMKKQKLVS